VERDSSEGGGAAAQCSSRSLVEMSSSAKRLTLETMAVLLNESHAEALAEAGLEHMIGADVTMELTTLGRRSYRVTSDVRVAPDARFYDPTAYQCPVWAR
jgi:predicted TIM-barrel enzyme